MIALMLSLVLTGWSLAASPPGDAPAEPAVEVEMTDDLRFVPGRVEVEVGETVRWVNTSVLVHTVTADPGEATMDRSVQLPDGARPFDSGRMRPDDTFEHTFEVPGTYTYFCIPHEGANMRADVVVKTASTDETG